MGFRTVVILINDQASEWENDPELGKKIMQAASMKSYGGDGGKDLARAALPYGEIVEQCHADQQTLVALDGYNSTPVGYGCWHPNQTPEQRDLQLLKSMAEKLGYRLSKLPRKG